ncbi:MAG TPA: cupin-like domain-containing protein [Verrucomicrobiae bacterium]|nr:cupin-like domain-containing protein [Verrucomicrobiae bacterium]
MITATARLHFQPIERTSGLTPETFHQHFLTGPGKPVVLTDAITSWPALSRWSFEQFKNRYGSDSVTPRTWMGPSGMKFLKLMRLSDFIDYLDAPDRPAPGLWVDRETMHPSRGPAEDSEYPLYLAWNVFARHPELLGDVELSPKFVEDLLPFLPEALRKIMDGATKYFIAGVMVGPKNSQIGLHYDFLESHAYLAQIIGKKRCVLFSPADSAALYDGKVNVDAPDFEKFPLLQNATAYECTLEPGELLFIPFRWWHHAVCLEKSITVNYNFFNRVNMGGYITHLLRDLPALVDGITQLPEERAALGIKWTSRGFDFPDSGKA